MGPVMGPSLPLDASVVGPSLPEAEEEGGEGMPPRSAGDQLATRDSSDAALLRDLTLPTVPNLEIPPSPPGTPPPSLAALNKKFDNFLDAKRRKGTHFHARLAQSAALKNPGLMDKLLGFVGLGFSSSDVDGEGGKSDPAAQYATALPSELWDPAGFPEWAFRGPLKKSQEAVQKARARGAGEPVAFVTASSSGSKAGSRTGTPTRGGLGKRKTRFDA